MVTLFLEGVEGGFLVCSDKEGDGDNGSWGLIVGDEIDNMCGKVLRIRL